MLLLCIHCPFAMCLDGTRLIKVFYVNAVQIMGVATRNMAAMMTRDTDSMYTSSSLRVFTQVSPLGAFSLG